jgi:hypothetical protein
MSDPGSTLGDEQHRTCPQCGADCHPEPFQTDDGFRIAFVCAEHGVHSVLDPFEGKG